MKLNWKFMSLIVSASVLFTGCEPPVDRNAETPGAATPASEEKVLEAQPKTDSANADAAAARPSDASMDLVPEGLRVFTEFPAEKTTAAMKAYLDSLNSSEFMAVYLSLSQNQNEESRIGLMAAQKIINENRKLAADLILGAEDATAEQYRTALLIHLDDMMNSNASVDGMDVQFKAFRDQVAASRFPEMANLVDCQLNSLKLMEKAQKLFQAEAPKPEQVEEFYVEYLAQVDAVLAADMLSDYQIQMILGLTQLFQDQPNRVLEVFEKLDAALAKKTDSKWTQLRGMLAQQIENLKKDVKIQSTKPEQVAEFLAPYRDLPKEMTAKNCAEFLTRFTSPEFQETAGALFAVKNEEVQKAVMAEMETIQKNAETAVETVMKSEDATEEEFKTALNLKFHLAMAYSNPEEKPSMAQLKERYEALKAELEKSRFPQFAAKADCYAQAVGILEKSEAFLNGSSQPTQEQKDALYPEFTKFAENVVKSGAADGLPMEVIMQVMGLFRSEKEKMNSVLEIMIKGLDGKTDEDSQMLLRSLKMQQAMLENPQAMGQAAPQGAADANQAPAKPELTPEEIEGLKTKFEAFTKLPEDRSAASLMTFVQSLDGLDFQTVAAPLFQVQDEAVQKWLTEAMDRLNDSLKEALSLVCKSEDATEEQFREALQFRLDVMRAEKARKNVEPDYAALTEEVKAGRFPALVSMVELDANAAELMAKANALFTSDAEPTAEQLDGLFAEFMPYVGKVISADALKGPQLQAIMQLTSIFTDDTEKMTQICQTILKGLEGKEDPQSKSLSEMLQKRLDEISFLTKPMEFTAPEGTELAELKKMVTQKMEVIMRSMQKELPDAKLKEFLAAVEKFGNADLTAYTAWQIDLIHLIPSLQGADFDLKSFKAKYLECVKTGTEKNLFNVNCLQMCLQMAAIASQKSTSAVGDESKAILEEMLSALLPVCDEVKDPKADAFRKEIETMIKQLKSAPAETETTTPAPAPTAENLPEAIQLEDAALEAPTEALPAPAESAPAAPVSEPAAEPAPAAESVSESTSTVEEADDEEEELEEDELEEDESDDASEASVEIPAPILKLISLSENATTEECAAFLNLPGSDELGELQMQLSQTQNQALMNGVLTLLRKNLEVASEKILTADDAKAEAYSLAMTFQMLFAAQSEEGGKESLEALKATVEKGKFAEKAKAVEVMIQLFDFQKKLTASLEKGEPKPEELAKFFEEFKSFVGPALENSDSSQSALVGMLLQSAGLFQANDAQMLELCQLLSQGLEKKEGEEWNELKAGVKAQIERREIAVKPIEFTAEEGASSEELRKLVDEKVNQILSGIQGEAALTKLEELRTAVTKLKNDSLTAYVNWETGLFIFFQSTLEKLSDENFESASILTKITALTDQAAELKVASENFLQLLQISNSMMNVVEDCQDEKVAVAEKLLEMAKTYDSEDVKQILPSLENWIEELKNPEEAENSEDEDEDEEEEASDAAAPKTGDSETGSDPAAVREELDAAVKPFVTLPEEPNAEKMSAFIQSFNGPKLESLVTAMQQFPEPAYAQAQFQKMIQALQNAVEFVLDAEDATQEQLKDALNRKLSWLGDAAEANEIEALKARLAKHQMPELAQVVDCWQDAVSFEKFFQENMESENLSEEKAAQVLERAKKLLESAKAKNCLNGLALRVLCIVSEVLPSADQKLELMKALREAVSDQETEDAKELVKFWDEKIEKIENLKKPAEFKSPKEDAAIEELKKAAHEQLASYLEIESEADSQKKIQEFKNSVQKFGNEELITFVNWEISLNAFLTKISKSADEKLDLEAISAEFTEIVKDGSKKKAFQPESLQLITHIGLSLAPAIKEDSALKLLEMLQTILGDCEEAWAEEARQQLDGKLAQLRLVGNPVELEAEDLDGKPVKIQDFAGKTVLIDVWATWCGPCVGEIPNIRRAYEAYHDAGFEVIGLSLDENLEDLKAFVKKELVPWEIVIQPQKEGAVSFADRYGITGIPAMFLVGADGKVITIRARGRLMELLAEIYPDVKVKEAENVPDAIELDEEANGEEDADDADDAEDEAVTPSEATAGVEDSASVSSAAPAVSSSSSEESIVAAFMPPESKELPELKKNALNQMMELILKTGEAKANPVEEMKKFQASVHAYGNEELTQFMDWNVEFLDFFFVRIRQNASGNVNELGMEFAQILRKGNELNAFSADTLMTSVQFSMNYVSVLEEAPAMAIIDEVMKAIDASSEEWAPQVRKLMEGKRTQLQLPGKALELEAQTLDGKPLKIQDFVGKTVLVDVWATWCGPCLGEIPNMRKAYDAYHEAGFEIIGLSVDEDFEKLKSFVESAKIPWVIATQPKGSTEITFSEKYGISGIPAMFLVGADGKVLTIQARGKLMELLAEIYPEAAAKQAAAEKEREKAEADALEALEKSLETTVPAEVPANAPAAAPEASDLPAVPSESMSTTEEASAESAAEASAESSSAILDSLSTLPANPTLESLREFLQLLDRSGYEVQTALRQMDEMAAYAKFRKIQDVRSQAADLLIADANATKEDLKFAVEVKTSGILFATQQTQDQKAANEAFEKLIAALEARSASEAVLQAQVAQLLSAAQFANRMPTADEMAENLGKITAICEHAREAKTMNGDVMGHFMQMIVFANDCGVAAEKIDQACVALREAVLATGDPQLINTADFITGMARRAALQGKPMELVGVTLDGKEMNLQKDFAGKVVLVDFWATWCNPCVMELTNLERQYYAKYHEKGFEILGFSIDVDRNQLTSFLERRKLPWLTILQKDHAKGCEEPVYYYGIQAIPCLILVGPDGKVIREIPTMRRDEVLSAELKKIYGE